jgi:hypothetical protein
MPKNKHTKPFHLHLEHFFRKRYCLLAVLALLLVAVAKADHKTFGLMREAYLHGYGMVGQYMREETSRVSLTFEIGARTPTHSGR